jgi:hypothetical protein
MLLLRLAPLRRRCAILLVLCCVLAMTCCDAHLPVNAPIPHQDTSKGYRLERIKADPDNPGDVLVILTRSSFEMWQEKLSTKRRASGRGGTNTAVGFCFIDVSLQAIADEAERNSFQSIATALTVDPAAVGRLRAVARKQLLASPDFKRLAADLGN